MFKMIDLPNILIAVQLYMRAGVPAAILHKIPKVICHIPVLLQCDRKQDHLLNRTRYFLNMSFSVVFVPVAIRSEIFLLFD